jgi:hypothetical protein
MLGGRTWREPRALPGVGPSRRVMHRFAATPVVGPGAALRRPAQRPLEVAGARAAAMPVPAPVAAAADDLAVLAAIALFEHRAGMGSAEFAQRYQRGEFGHVAWARVWFGLLQ